MSVSHLELCTATAGPQQHHGSEGRHTAEQLKHRRWPPGRRKQEANVGADKREGKTREKEVVNLQEDKMRNEKRLVMKDRSASQCFTGLLWP